MIPHDIYAVIERMRARPAVWLGEASVHRLHIFLQGYEVALHDAEIRLAEEQPPFPFFHDFVTKTLGFGKSSIGWAGAICERSGGDGATAFLRFFELLDQFRAGGPPRSVAFIDDPELLTGIRMSRALEITERFVPVRIAHFELFEMPHGFVFAIDHELCRMEWFDSEDDAYSHARRRYGIERSTFRRAT